ncbi:hypothetical protein TUM19329_10970 [Legionella antarctica]|uniref:Uncharacterized protein n=1 Tax=Legionella antarctica TaxID=2708020 RepID=A0A6F8T444_9GAMM|nr:hypothetical protein [Legionella antarctica]BCA94736.1 hypothetical protein TUM19329_10970 [Legionella antarctica]
MHTTKFFGEEQNIGKMFTLGGLCSCYQFTYHDARIVLLGEIHETMTRKLANEYIEVLNQFISKYGNVAIFLESIESDEKNVSDQLSFMDSILSLVSPDMKVTHADKRHYNEEFTDLFFYFKTLSDLPSSKASYFDDPKFIDILHELAEGYNKNLSFSDLFSLLNLEIARLIQLEMQITPLNLQLSEYVKTCIKNLDIALDKVRNLQKEHCLVGGHGAESDSIIDICIERMKQTKSFQIIIAWLEIYYLYEIYHFDATLIMDLWSTLHHQSDNNKTFIIVSGNTHTEHLANLLNSIAVPFSVTTPEKQESRIAPVTLEEVLTVQFGCSVNTNRHL